MAQVFPLGGQLHASVWPHLHLSRLYLLAADVLFLVPLWRHYMSVGAVPAAGVVLNILCRCVLRSGPDHDAQLPTEMTCAAGGAASATSETMHKLLKEGHSVGIHVGGIAEMFETYPDRDVIYLSMRRGFLRAAAEHGVPVIPMYHFGVTQVLSFFPRYVYSTAWAALRPDGLTKCSLFLSFLCCRSPAPRLLPESDHCCAGCCSHSAAGLE